MILPPSVDVIELLPKGKEMVVVENSHDMYKKEREEASTEEDPNHLLWEESYLLRFIKFLGMSSNGYEHEGLNLMYKISDIREKGKGKEVSGMTKFDREMKNWSGQ